MGRKEIALLGVARLIVLDAMDTVQEETLVVAGWELPRIRALRLSESEGPTAISRRDHTDPST